MKKNSVRETFMEQLEQRQDELKAVLKKGDI